MEILPQILPHGVSVRIWFDKGGPSISMRDEDLEATTDEEIRLLMNLTGIK
jgi:hypothetical protein